MVKPPLRTKTVGTKLSEAEYAQLEDAARKQDQTLSEWCRQTLLASVNQQSSNAHPAIASQALMAELLALRTILLNVLYKQAQGEKLSAEEMQRLIERADTDKLKKAQTRLERATNSQGT
jgi:hypothetical protein